MSEMLNDPLTGLMTPFNFYQSAERLQSWANRREQPLSLISITIPSMSEERLARCARELLAELRGGDLLCRMGEFRFVLLLLGDEAAAGHLIFRLQNVIKPKLDFASIGFDAGEDLVYALERLGI